MLTISQNSKIRNACNNRSTDTKLRKSQLSKIIWSGGFLATLLGYLAGPIIKMAIPQAKTVLLPLWVTTEASAACTLILKKLHGRGTPNKIVIILAISSKKMNEIIKIMKPLEDLNLTIDGISEAVKDDIKE